MKIKRFMIVVIASFLCIMVSAQEAECDSVVIANEDSCSIYTIQSAIDACIMLAESAESKDTIALRNAKNAMQAGDFAYLFKLRRQNREEESSLNGHLIFNVAFADSLAEGRDPYKDADDIDRKHRGQSSEGQILTKTCFIKANGKAIYTFKSHDRQELAVVAEPGGLITNRIHVVNEQTKTNEWHNDTKDVTKGRNSRKSAFTLPHTPRSVVTLEITNCTNKDISVVVISN